MEIDETTISTAPATTALGVTQCVNRDPCAVAERGLRDQ